jgi:hypothetical protein
MTTTKYRNRVYWLLGDTALTVPGADAPYSTNFYWASNTMSSTHDLDASDGLALDYDWLDSTGAPTEFMPLTDDERTYNLAHKKGEDSTCGEVPCVLWPGVMVPDPARHRILVFYGKVHRGGGASFQGIGTGIAVWDPHMNKVTRPVVKPGGPEPTLMWREELTSPTSGASL